MDTNLPTNKSESELLLKDLNARLNEKFKSNDLLFIATISTEQSLNFVPIEENTPGVYENVTFIELPIKF